MKLEHVGLDRRDDLREAVATYERNLLEAALKRARYYQRTAAAALKLSYDQLRHALKKHDLLERSGDQ